MVLYILSAASPHGLTIKAIFTMMKTHLDMVPMLICVIALILSSEQLFKSPLIIII